MIPFTQIQIQRGKDCKQALLSAGFTPAQAMLALAHINTETANFTHIVVPNNYTGIQLTDAEMNDPNEDKSHRPPASEHGKPYKVFKDLTEWAVKYHAIVARDNALTAVSPDQYAIALKKSHYMQAPLQDVVRNFQDGYLKAQMYFTT